MAGALTGWAGRVGRLVPRGIPERRSFPYAAWTIAWFVIFLVLTFPHELIVRHWIDDVAAKSGWQIRFDNVWLRPWNGYHMSRFELVAPGKDADPWIAADEVALRPPLLALFGRGVMPLGFSGDAYGGAFDGVVTSPSHVEIAWSHLRLGRYPRLGRLVEGTWAGDFSGELELESKGDVQTLDGKASLHLKDASLTQGKVQGFTVPDLHFATGDGEAEIKSGRIEIRTLKLTGPDVDAELRGQLYFVNTNAVPMLSGTLSLKPIPGSPANLEPLLMLWNQNQRPPNGVFSFTLSGALNAPRVR
jgi:type II secretion system protein N